MGTADADMLKYICEYMGNVSQQQVVSIQQCPGRVARVTFELGGEAAKAFLEEEGSTVSNGD